MTAFLLCRYLTHSTWAAVVGGYLFGFSSYMLGGELSHVHTVAVFLVPVAVLLVLRFLDGELSARRLALGLGVVLAAQLWLSTEIVFTATLALLGALLLAAVLLPARRRRLRLLLAPLAGAYAFAAVLAAPLLYYAFTGRSSHPTQQSSLFVADALNFVVPTPASLGGWWTEGARAAVPSPTTSSAARTSVCRCHAPRRLVRVRAPPLALPRGSCSSRSPWRWSRASARG